ncbi:MAG TPA: Nramp family divalent metal transporter [Flavisolibacter sp.]
MEAKVPSPPKGRQVFKWLGPGFLWMVSAAGSGELLFSPRVGSMYGYTLLWALFAAVILKFFINREIGRFAVCTGLSVVDGFAGLKSPGQVILWIILVPQLFVAVISIAGLAGGAATALTLFLPGHIGIWMIVSVLLATALVLWGKYKGVEKASIFLASALAIASIIAAVAVSPSMNEFAAGFKPDLSQEIDLSEILPWLGFMMSGAAGMMWYSYWIPAKGYGMSALKKEDEDHNATGKKIPAIKNLSAADKNKLRGWIRTMSLDTTSAVIGTLIITLAFIILGTELLKPQGLVPEENKVAETLGKLLEQLWGPVGFWFMIVGVFIGFWDTVLSDQDGHSRLFANGTRHLLGSRLKGNWKTENYLKGFFVIVLVTILPIILYLFMGNPVELLKLSGAIEAAHIPVVTGLTLYLNKKTLPKELQPSTPIFIITILAGLFFAVFASLFILQTIGLVEL